MSERPWVSVDVSVFDWVKPDPNGLAIPLQFVLTNHGNSVALSVAVVANAFLANGKYDPFKEQRQECDPIKEGKETRTGISLFPTETKIERIAYEINKRDIAKVQQSQSRWAATPQNRSTYEASLLPMIIGCVNYSYIISPVFHQTGFIYSVEGIRADSPGPFAILEGQSTQAALSNFGLWQAFYAN